MKTLGIDFGASFVDAVLFDGTKIIAKRSVARQYYTPLFLKTFPAFDNLFATGAKIHKKMNYLKEFDCLARGGLFLTRLDCAVIVSAGTGTACVLAQKDKKVVHLGGTGVGGGTLIGLGKLLLKIEKPQKLLELAKSGNRSNVDLTVGDILGKGVGILSKDATAANFGKLRHYELEDIALSLVAMIAETIAMVSCLAAKTVDQENIVFVGRLSTNDLTQKYLKEVCRIFGLTPHFPDNASYAVALGAALG